MLLLCFYIHLTLNKNRMHTFKARRTKNRIRRHYTHNVRHSFHMRIIENIAQCISHVFDGCRLESKHIIAAYRIIYTDCGASM